MNINRDYLIINDVKKSNIKLDNGSMFFYITDKNTQNIFVNLVINVSNNELIQKYANIENAEDYTLTMNIVKPSNTYKIVEGKLHDKENAIFEFNLNEDYCDEIGTYRCELLTKCNINGHEEITTSNKLTYKVKSSVLNDLDEIVEAPEYPLVIQLFDKLSDIEQYEEDRRANELARQLAEEQRQARFNTLDADMTNSIQAIDNKVVDVENRISAKEEVVDKLVADTKADIDEYKVAKDQEIDEYKSAKDTEINNAITAQDNKIDEAISEQNDRITAVENNDVAQDNRLDTLEAKDTLHESRLDATEAKNTEQDSRLDIVENKNTQQDNRLNDIEAKNVEQDNRLDNIEAIDVAQNSRLDTIEVKNQQQDDRLLDIEKANKRQDMNLKCLFAESKNNMIDVTEEGNSIYLQNSTTGYTLIDEIKGNTLVNCNKEPDKELILNGNINTSGDNTVTLTEGVDGGLVDVALEGNTLVNVSKTKDSTAISKAYTVENSGNHIALQGDVDGSCRPVVNGKTLVNIATSRASMPMFYKEGGGKINLTQDLTNAKFLGDDEYSQGLAYYLSKACEVGKIYTLICDFDNRTTAEKLLYIGQISYEGSSIATIAPNTKSHIVYSFTMGENYKLGTNLYQFKSEDNYVAFNNLIILEGDYTNKPIPDYFTGLQSTFEDNLVTQEMVDTGEEVADNLGKYKVDYKSTREDGTVGSTKTLYLNSPLLEGDTIEEKDGGIYHVHTSELVPYTEGDETSLITDKVNTLHQLETPTYELIEQSNLVIPSYTNGHLDFDTAVPVEKVDFLPFSEELTYLYASTQYTVQFMSDRAVTADITLGGTSLLAQSIVAGLNRIAITTPATLVDNKLIISGVGANISEVVVTDTDREFMYFEGMKSVGECEDNMIEILSTTNNLLDLSLIDGLVEEDGKIVAKRIVNGSNSSLKLKPNTRYKVTMEKYDDNPSWIGIGYTANGVYTSVGNSADQPNRVIEFTTPNKKDIKFYIGANNLGDIGNYLRLIKLEYANSSSTSSIAKHNKKTMTHEPLRAVGGVKDRYVLIDGKWYIERNVVKLTYDGTDSSRQWKTWLSTAIEQGDCVGFYDYTQGLKHDVIEDDTYITVLNDNLPFISLKAIRSGSKEGIATGKGIDRGYFAISINKNKLNSVTHAGLNEWLNRNPITIVAIGEPYYEPIDYNPLEVYSDITHITTNSTIPANITVKNHGFNCLLKPSTTYTISSNLGVNTVTTPSTLTEDCLRFMDTDTSDITTMRDVLVLEGDWTTKADLIPANFSGIESAFEQEYDAEKGKYKVNIKVANEDKSKENNITFYIDEPLRGVGVSKDKVFIKGDKVVVERNCGIREYQDGDFGTYPTDKVDTVYQLAEPTYEEVEYNDTKLFIESFKNSTLFYNSNVPVTSKLYYSYSVPIVDTVAQTANVTDQQDSMIIDLATQVAVMEMMLM